MGKKLSIWKRSQIYKRRVAALHHIRELYHKKRLETGEIYACPDLNVEEIAFYASKLQLIRDKIDSYAMRIEHCHTWANALEVQANIEKADKINHGKHS